MNKQKHQKPYYLYENTKICSKALRFVQKYILVVLTDLSAYQQILAFEERKLCFCKENFAFEQKIGFILILKRSKKTSTPKGEFKKIKKYSFFKYFSYKKKMENLEQTDIDKRKNKSLSKGKNW